MTKADTLTVRDFCALAGFSVQRLYKLWAAGRGPARYVVREPGRRPRVAIPAEAGRAWIENYRRHVAALRRQQGAAYRAVWRELKEHRQCM